MRNYQNKIFAAVFILNMLVLHVFLQAQIMDSEAQLRVRIIDNADSLKIHFNTHWQISGADKTVSPGDSIVTVKTNNKKIFLQKDEQVFYSHDSSITFDSAQGSLVIFDVPYGTGWWWAGKENRLYEGTISFYRTSANKIDVTVQLPLEQYLKGVVPYEIGGDTPLEAMKAQAVAARSEAIMALRSGLYSGPYYDLTSDVECQVFAGNYKRTALSDEAVDKTAGLVLTENGQPIHAYYASNCGGHCERIENVWPERPAPQTYRQALSDSERRTALDLSNEDAAANWIRSQPDVYCNPYLVTELPPWSTKNFRWVKTESITEISHNLSRGQEWGQLLQITALNRGPSGRIYHARFIFEKDSFDVKGELNIRQLWHPALRSSCFISEKTDSTFILMGAGWGHGVGMCQSGAIAQARQGKSFAEILKHYYPGTSLSAVYSTKTKNIFR